MNSTTKTLTDTPADKTNHAAFDNIPETFYGVDSAGKVIFMNACGRENMGLSLESIKTLSILDINPEINPGHWKSIMQKAAEKGMWVLQTPQRNSEANLIPVELRIRYQHDEDYYYCMTRILEQDCDSERLLSLIATTTAGHTGERFLESLMEQMAKILHVRHAFITECLDQPPSKVRMLAFWSQDKLAQKLEYELVDTPCDSVINAKKRVFVADNLGVKYPKEKGFADSYFGVPIYDTSGSLVIGHMAFLDDAPMSDKVIEYTVFDILASRAAVEMQRRRAENALRESEAKYRLLIENQTDLILKLDLDANITFVSLSCCERLGKTQADLLQKSVFSLIHSAERKSAYILWKKVIESPQEQSEEFRTRTPQGWCWYAWSLKLLSGYNEEGLEIVAVGRDVSKQRQAEKQVRKTLQQLSHVGRLSSMGEMASGIAHELNQPLTAIMGFAQASRRMLDSDTLPIEEYKKILDRIASNANTAGEIIRRMRNFAKKGGLKKCKLNVSKLVADVIDLLGTEMRHKDVHLSIHIADDMPPVYGDSIQLQQVLVNLIQNAIEAINEYPMKTK